MGGGTDRPSSFWSAGGQVALSWVRATGIYFPRSCADPEGARAEAGSQHCDVFCCFFTC